MHLVFPSLLFPVSTDLIGWGASQRIYNTSNRSRSMKRLEEWMSLPAIIPLFSYSSVELTGFPLEPTTTSVIVFRPLASSPQQHILLVSFISVQNSKPTTKEARSEACLAIIMNSSLCCEIVFVFGKEQAVAASLQLWQAYKIARGFYESGSCDTFEWSMEPCNGCHVASQSGIPPLKPNPPLPAKPRSICDSWCLTFPCEAWHGDDYSY